MRAWVPADPSLPVTRPRARPRLPGLRLRGRRPPGPPGTAPGEAVPDPMAPVRRAAAERLARAPLGAEIGRAHV